MTLSVRRGALEDAAVAGDICYRAFKSIADAHNFPPDIPSPDAAAGMIAMMIAHERVFDVVAWIDGTIVGSIFLNDRDQIAGVGPITVDPARQDDGAGRELMRAVMRRSEERAFAGVRLVQAGYHNRSLALYLKLGFEAREQLACMQGPVIGETVSGLIVRPATAEDLPACNQLCRRVHGHDRAGELAESVGRGGARVVERAGRVSGYATSIAFFGHAVGETNDDAKALIGAAEGFPGPGLLVPTRNGELMRRCLSQGLRIVQTMTLMTSGLYNQPDGAWLPSILY